MDYIEEEGRDPDDERKAKLEAFAATLCQKRKEAIDARKLSGIEAQWQEDDDYYQGIDEANRGEIMLKPSTPEGRPFLKQPKRGHRSTVFVNITQPYVDMGAARVADMLLPTDDKPFGITPTPVPEVSDVTQSSEMMPDGQATVGEAAKQFIAEMSTKADKAETVIWDWLTEARWHSEMRKIIEQSARIGASCLKGPFPVKRKKRVMTQDEAGLITLAIEEVIKPDSKWVDIWNIFPDPSCGDNIHNGNFIFERDFVSARQLQELKGTGFIDAEIDDALKEGPNKKNIDGSQKAFQRTQENEQFEIWYYHGFATHDELMSAGCECEEGAVMPVIVTMVNDRVIKASMAVLDSGEFPYDIMVWQRRTDHWSGIGVARQVRTPQRMVNAAARNLMDNAGVSAGPQIVIRDGIISPADGEYTITPLKIWRVDENADIQDVKNAITSIVIPTLQVELERIIKMALEFAERATSMPLLLQGQQGASTDTVGGMQILQANASTVLRRIARICDDNITEPHITRYYEWLMIHPGNEDAKGDYCIVPKGSSAFFERDAQNQMILQMIPMASNAAFGLDPNKLMTEFLKMNKISPERVRFTDEEIQQMQQAAKENPPQDPRVAGQIQVAQLKTQADMEREKLRQTSDAQEIDAKAKAAQDEMALKLQMQQQEHEHQERIEQLRYQMKLMELSQAQNISIDSIKASLADTAMRLRVQKDLSAEKGLAKQVATPPSEPQGKAPDGQAYQK